MRLALNVLLIVMALKRNISLASRVTRRPCTLARPGQATYPDQRAYIHLSHTDSGHIIPAALLSATLHTGRDGGAVVVLEPVALVRHRVETIHPSEFSFRHFLFGTCRPLIGSSWGCQIA